ncbi:winged helix-turn-helix domain-containing protein [Methylicorpusculum oleiharenae]|uniref:winged helix-turn-helix domain-containing protein n=1 Tax=Methylicorpusculum TaxID=2713642 RepID=UPI0013575156|nr:MULTISPECIES: winged helix-turn-helix domain-containing protein [Methylicorpusculum]MCD2450898.1 winged helix-turn-helix domain-containing protein [Methylicorpusculum oleiharenae]MDO8842985.1 winged helix-turn-helix domain-containing protein [Methylicorpusculum sp.]
MVETIGQTAGKVWKFLEDNGTATVNKITNETGLSKNDIQRAIGWLAREEKIIIEMVNGRIENISLV